MNVLERNLTEDVTYWSGVDDGYGGKTFSTPQIIKGRWEDRSEVYVDQAGEQLVSNAVVYLMVDVEVDNFIAQGSHVTVADPSTLAGAFIVKRFDKIPNLRNVSFQRKVMV